MAKKEKWITVKVLEGSEIIPPNTSGKASLAVAMVILQRKLKRDKEYCHTWMCNIQMCQYDALTYNNKVRKGKKLTTKDMLEISEQGANEFLKLLCS